MKKWWLLGIGVLLIAGAVYAYFAFKKEEQPVAAAVNTTQVRKGTLEVSVSGTGSIQVGDRKTVTAGKQGTIKEVKVKENSVVKKGDVLIVLEGEDNSDQIKSEEVNLEKKLLELTDLQARYKSETDTNSLSSLDLSMKKQKIDIEQSRTSIAKLKEKQEEISIIAPIGGTVKSLTAAADDELTPQTQIAEIVDYANLQIVVSIDELDIPKVKVGQAAVISVEALTDQTFQGKVTAIADEGTASNGVATFDVTISVEASKDVKAGMSAEASISIEKKENTLILPIDAVQSLGNRYIVLLPASTQGANGQAGDQPGGQAGSMPGGDAGGQSSGASSGQPTAPAAQQGSGTGRQAGDQQSGQTGWQRNGGAAQGSSNRGAGRFGNGTPQQIEVGIHNEDYIEVLSGLKEGDLVILPTVVTGSSTSQQRQAGLSGFGGIGGVGGMGGGGGFPGGGGGFEGGGARSGAAGTARSGGSQAGGGGGGR